jgi:hypothetical protein
MLNDDSKSTFGVMLGSLDNAFSLDHDTGELNYLNEATQLKNAPAKPKQSSISQDKLRAISSEDFK